MARYQLFYDPSPNIYRQSQACQEHDRSARDRPVRGQAVDRAGGVRVRVRARVRVRVRSERLQTGQHRVYINVKANDRSVKRQTRRQTGTGGSINRVGDNSYEQAFNSRS